MAVYNIYEGNWDRFIKKITRIQNKCKKYNQEFTFENLGEVFQEVINEKTGAKEVVRFIQVEVSGLAKVNGYTFLAGIEQTETGNIIRDGNSNKDIDYAPYFKAALVCEHCKQSRNRKYAYLVLNDETNEIKMVGKECLKDFTGGLDAEAVAFYESFIDEVSEYSSFSFSSMKPYYKVRAVLQIASEVIRIMGFVPTQQEFGNQMSTKAVVRLAYDNIFGHGDENDKTWKYLESKGFNWEAIRAEDMALRTLDWVAGQEADSSYMNNLKVLLGRDYCERRDLGFIVSSIRAYQKAEDKRLAKIAKEQERQNQREASKHVGNIGDRIEVQCKYFRRVASWETQYGTSFRYVFEDMTGNQFTWVSSTWVDDTASGTFIVKGTVKAHDEYNGIAQTVVTRCKLTIEPEKEVREEKEDVNLPDFMKMLDEAFSSFDSTSSEMAG